MTRQLAGTANMAALRVAVPATAATASVGTPVTAVGGVASSGDAFTVVVLGASGDLAHKKTYPSLFELFVSGLLPRNLNVVGFARSPISDADFREKIKPSLKGGSPKQVDDFLALCVYRHGGYDDEAAFRHVAEEMATLEAAASLTGAANRLFYFAIPPTVFTVVAKSIHAAALSTTGWNRIVIEKPFGKDLASSNALSAELGKYFTEDQIYRIDHYLGKEMVQNLFVLRFANAVFEPLWNRHHISNVQVRLKGSVTRQLMYISAGVAGTAKFLRLIVQLRRSRPALLRVHRLFVWTFPSFALLCTCLRSLCKPQCGLTSHDLS